MPRLTAGFILLIRLHLRYDDERREDAYADDIDMRRHVYCLADESCLPL